MQAGGRAAARYAAAEKEDTATAGAAGVTPADKEDQKAARGTVDGRLDAHDAKRRKLDESRTDSSLIAKPPDEWTSSKVGMMA